MPASPNVTFRASHGLADQIEARGDSLSEIARRDLDRYYDAIKATRKEIALSEGEWAFLRDILGGTFIEFATADMLWAEVEDAEPEYAEKWGVDKAALAAKIRAMPVFARLAICDYVERWWRGQ